MNKKILFLLAFCAFLSTFSASAQAPFISATPNPLTLRATGDTAFFTVNSGDSVFTISTATLPTGWTMTPTAGFNGSTTIRVTAPANTSNAEMLCTFNIISRRGNVFHTEVMTLVQAASSNPTTFVCADNTEPNNSLAQAYDWGALTTGTRQLTPLCLTGGDNDYFKFTINGTRFYARVRGFSSNNTGVYGLEATVAGNIVTLRTIAVNGANADTYLYLLNANGNTIEENDDISSNLLSQVTANYVAPAALSVSQSSLIFTGDASSDTFAVTSANVVWQITGMQSWLTVTPTTDSTTGRRIVTVNPTANTTTFPRAAYLTIAGGSRSFRVLVTQYPQPIIQTPCADPYEPNDSYSTAREVALVNNTFVDTTLCLSPQADNDFFRFSVRGTTFYAKVSGYGIAIVGKYGLQITAQGDNITLTTFSVSGSNTDTYLVLLDANSNILAANDDYGSTNFSNVNFNIGLQISPSSLSFSVGGGAQGINIFTNNNWTLTGLPQWLTASAMSGNSGNSAIRLTATPNLDTVPRIANINFTTATATVSYNVSQLANRPIAGCNDPYEPNNSFVTPTDIGTIALGGTWRNDQLCLTAGDEDYFRFVYNSIPYFLRVRGFSSTSTGLYGLQIVGSPDGNLTISTLSVANSNTDTYVALMTPTSLVLAANDDYNGTVFSRIAYNSENFG